MIMNGTFSSLPQSWSALSWTQLCDVWRAKMRYGGNADVARPAALLALLGCSVCGDTAAVTDAVTGEPLYTIADQDGHRYTVSPRQLAHAAIEALRWFDFPYGDHGEKEELDEKGNVVKERREGVNGYVSPMRDAMVLPQDYIVVTSPVTLPIYRNTGIPVWRESRRFALPQAACNNLTWQQYRSLQAIAPQLFSDDANEGDALSAQAKFLAHCLVPRSFALLDTAGGSIRFRPHWEYRYNAEQAESLSHWFLRELKRESAAKADITVHSRKKAGVSLLFHICFQAYQTAMSYYATVYPLLFQDSGKEDPLRDALTGEVSTVNTIMKYAGYAEQQQVYDSNLPFVLDILNTMTREAKEIEKMNSKIKKK